MARSHRYLWLLVAGSAGCVAVPRAADLPAPIVERPVERVVLPEPQVARPIPAPPAIDPDDVKPLQRLCRAECEPPALVPVCARESAAPSEFRPHLLPTELPSDPAALADHLDQLRRDIAELEPKAELRVVRVGVVRPSPTGEVAPGELIEIELVLVNLGPAGRPSLRLEWPVGDAIELDAPAGDVGPARWVVRAVVPELPPGRTDLRVRAADAATGRVSERTAELVVGARRPPYN